jgi:hypothetical protein
MGEDSIMQRKTDIAVQQALADLRSPSTLSELFADTLNYQLEGGPLVTRDWKAERAAESLLEGKVIASHDDFHVIYCQIPRLLLTVERPIVNQILRHVSPYSLVIFADSTNRHWHFVNVKYDERAERRRVFRRIAVGPDERLHTAVQRIALLEITDEAISPLALQSKHDEAFDVEPVTKEFYETYKELFSWTRGLIQGKQGQRETHAFTQQLLNRLMFLYFVQKLYYEDDGERHYWLNNDPFYMKNLFELYKTSGRKDEFFSVWLEGLFFQAFRKQYGFQVFDLPKEVKNQYANMPWLNGGLFEKSEWDQMGFEVPDMLFKRLYDELLEHFNFTVREDTPVDIEVAVDPVMLGHVYESLIAEEERGRSGIFYTQPTELYFMCRRALIEYLDGQVPLTTEEIIQLVLDVDTPDDLPDYDPTALAAVRQRLDEVKVVDPACGSGAFLVTMMNVIARLHELVAMRAGQKLNAFNLKKKIMANNLYGVDIKKWACRVAELRLWLSLIVETQGHDLDTYNFPLLPNLDYKIRQGDSLVQHIGERSLSLRGKFSTISRGLAQKINRFIRRKDDYFDNRGDRKVMIADIERLETEILRDVIDSKLQVVNRALGALESEASTELSKQLSFLGEEPVQPGLFEETEKARKERERRRNELAEEKARLLEARASVGKRQERDYFLWDIHFAEVFQERGGFDIVIANPPYVRQESIAPQNLLPEEITPKTKREYKEQLIRSVQTLWGKQLKIDRRSDLYVYFYFHGLGLLRPGGVFCFITSNSWLDVGYGACLQRFLLERMKVKAIYDNLAKRSFAGSDVNTVISLFQRPEQGEGLSDHPVRFVAFKKPFEDVVTVENLAAIQAAEQRTSTEDYRLRVLTQGQLLMEGSEKRPEEERGPQKVTGPLIKVARYLGDKWGGKYLRAPDIYFTILEKGKGKLVRLGDIAQVRFGVKTGANEFFYLPSKDFDLQKEGSLYRLIPKHEDLPSELTIEEEFLRPVIKSPREVTAIYVPPSSLKTRVFVCNRPKTLLQGTNALCYIEWGEKQKSKGRQKQEAGVPWPELPTMRGRHYWYSLEMKQPCDFFCNRFFNDRFFFCYSEGIVEDQTFYGGLFMDHDIPIEQCMAVLNASIAYLTAALLGRVALGEGVLQYAVYEMERLTVLSPKMVPPAVRVAMLGSFEQLRVRPIKPVQQEMNQADRRALDEITFDFLALTAGERDAVYEAVIGLVDARLKKAESM